MAGSVIGLPFDVHYCEPLGLYFVLYGAHGKFIKHNKCDSFYYVDTLLPVPEHQKIGDVEMVYMCADLRGSFRISKSIDLYAHANTEVSVDDLTKSLLSHSSFC